MASAAKKLIPSEPDKVMVIRRVTPNILICSTPFLRFGRVKIGGRGTVVKLESGSLAVFSPVALTPIVQAELASFSPGGTVKYLTALDQEHHIFLEDWHKAYPEAQIIGPESLPEYRDKQKYFKLPTERWTLFKKDAAATTISEEFDREFDYEFVHGHMNKELVFNHKPSKTLIEADLMFNLPATEQFSKTDQNPTTGIATKIFNGLQNTKGDATWQKRMLWYGVSSGDRSAFNKSIAKIVQWDFERIIPCHGDVIETSGKGVFEKVFKWHLDAVKAGK